MAQSFDFEVFGRPLMYLRIEATHIDVVKRLHKMIFPLPYSNSYFSDLLEPISQSYIILLGDYEIGIFCSAIRPNGVLYISTIGLIPTHRSAGIGNFVLDYFIKALKRENVISRVLLHVQVGNTGAIRFYKKFGFTETARIKNYYKRIEPSDALEFTYLL